MLIIIISMVRAKASGSTAFQHDHFIVERNGKGLAAVIPAAQWERIEAALRSELLKDLDHPAWLPQAEADRLANKAKHPFRLSGSRREKP